MKTFYHREYLLQALLLIAIFGVYLYNVFGEKMFAYNGGLGIDGGVYGNMLRNLPESLYNNTIPAYWYQKFFPVIIARIIIFISGMPIDNPLIVKSFIVIGTICIVASVLIYYKICTALKLSKRKVSVGLILMFVSFCFLKYAPYEPLLTDRVAFLESMLLMYSYLKGKWLLGWGVALIGLFTFPLVIWLTGVVLFSLKNKEHKRDYNVIPTYWAIAISIVPVMLMSYYVVFDAQSFSFYRLYEQTTFSWNSFTDTSRLILSVLAVLGFLYYSYSVVLKNTSFSLIRTVNISRLLIFIAPFIVLKIILTSFTGGSLGYDRTPIEFIGDISHQSLVYPLGYIESHFMFFGSVVVLFALFYKRIMSKLSGEYTGLFLALSVNLFFLISTESREFIYLLPMVVFAVLIATEDSMYVNRLYVVLLLFINLVVSFFWFRINTNPVLENLTVSRLEFPKQRAYMFFGPWRNVEMYNYFGLISLVGFLLIFAYTKLNRPKTDIAGLK